MEQHPNIIRFNRLGQNEAVGKKRSDLSIFIYEYKCITECDSSVQYYYWTVAYYTTEDPRSILFTVTIYK